MAGRSTTIAAVARIAGVALAYYAAARLALFMAIPPGYVTAVWPSAGIALIATLRWGRACALGVAAGSFAVNIGTNVAAGVAPAAALAASASVATGAALQALAGAALVRRTTGGGAALLALDDEREIVRFLALGGPVACLVGAAWAAATFGLAGVIPPEDLPFTAWTWWVGDTIGVLVFAPLALAIAGQPRDRWRGRRRPVALSLAIGFALVTWLFVRTSAWERSRLAAELDARGTAIAHGVEQHAQQSVEVVASVAAFMQIAPALRAADFTSIVSGQLARNPAIFAVAWAPRVTAAERAAFEAAARAEEPGYQIRERGPRGTLVRAGARPAYVPTRYLVLALPGESTNGFDLASEPTRDAALAHAVRTRAAAASAPLALLRGTAGYVVVVPALDASTGAPRGFAAGGFDAQRLFEAAVPAAAREGLAIAITDVTGAPAPLYGAAPPAAPWSRTLELAGRRWRLDVSFTGAPPRSWSAWLVLAGGLAGVGLLGTVLLIVTGRASRLGAAEERYRDLYENAPDMYVSIRADDGVIVECNRATARSLGCARDALIGRPVLELYAPGSRDAAREALAALRRDGEVRSTELQLQRADGSILDVSLHATGVRDERGALVRGRSVWRDITDAKQLERDRGFLLELGERLGIAADPLDLARETAAHLVAYLDAAGCQFSEIDRERGTVAVHESEPGRPPSTPRAVPLTRIERGGLGELFAGRHVVIEDTARDPRTVATHAEIYAPRGVRALLGVPLMRGGACEGAVTVTAAAPRAWTARELGLVQTVTERMWLWLEHVRMVHALRESEQHHRRIVETAHEGIWLADREWRTTFVNPRMAQMLGREPAELIGRPVQDFLDATCALSGPPDGRTQRVDDLRLLHRDGTAIWTRFATAPIVDADGDDLGTLAMVADLTERVRVEEELRLLGKELEQRVAQRTEALAESERRFRSLFAESPIALIEGDFSPALAYLDAQRARGVTDMRPHLEEAGRHVRVVAVNEASLDIFEAASEDQLVAALPQIFGREAFAMFRAEVREWRDGRSRLETEATVRTLGGQTRAIALRLSVIPGHEHDWTRVVVSIFDLTAHKQAEALARTAAHEKEVLLKEVHHRVKNNLQVISSLLNLQSHRLDDPRLRAAFADAKARVQSIALVHERLYRAHDLSRVNLDEYLRTLVEGLATAHDAGRRGIATRVAAGRAWVPVDLAIPCGLVVNELVTNALKYAFPAGTTGAIEVAVRSPAADRLELAVRDDGVGLPPELDPRRTTTLGLDLVLTFADQLGARVTISRAPGTAFVLDFPLPRAGDPGAA